MVASHGGGGAEDLVFGADLLHLALEPFILGGLLLGFRLEVREFGLQIFDVSLLPLAKGTLPTERAMLVTAPNKPQRRPDDSTGLSERYDLCI